MKQSGFLFKMPSVASSEFVRRFGLKRTAKNGETFFRFFLAFLFFL